jgi:hypothetical protein
VDLTSTGDPVGALAHTAQAQVQRATELTEDQRARWDTTLTLALVTHQQVATPISSPHPRQAADPL